MSALSFPLFSKYCGTVFISEFPGWTDEVWRFGSHSLTASTVQGNMNLFQRKYYILIYQKARKSSLTLALASDPLRATHTRGMLMCQLVRIHPCPVSQQLLVFSLRKSCNVNTLAPERASSQPLILSAWCVQCVLRARNLIMLQSACHAITQSTHKCFVWVFSLA